jgi:enamine deaminase RidA (YjgF/YER057c/UK114 family)
MSSNTPPSKHILSPTWEGSYSYSPAVEIRGGRTLMLAGHIGYYRQDGTTLDGDFEGQFHQTFKNIEATLARLGATLQDIVSMVVHVCDSRHAQPFVKLRLDLLKKDFPASTLLVISAFAVPGPLLEVTPVAWLPE